jgi:hypothetical protein
MAKRDCGAISNNRSLSILAKGIRTLTTAMTVARAQGASRHERGVNVFNVGRTLARERGWTLNWRLVELPGVGHSAQKMFAAPQLADALAP